MVSSSEQIRSSSDKKKKAKPQTSDGSTGKNRNGISKAKSNVQNKPDDEKLLNKRQEPKKAIAKKSNAEVVKKESDKDEAGISEKELQQTSNMTGEQKQELPQDISSDKEVSSNNNNGTAVAEKQSTTENGSSRLKGFVDETKSLTEALKTLGSIGSAFVLIWSTMKIYSYNSFYGIPVLNLSSISVLYSVLAHTIIVGVIIFLVYCQYVFLGLKDINFNGKGDKFVSLLLLLANVFLILFCAKIYVFDGFLSQHIPARFKKPEEIIDGSFIMYIGLVLALFTYPSIGLMILNSNKRNYNKSEQKKSFTKIKKKKRIRFNIILRKKNKLLAINESREKSYTEAKRQLYSTIFYISAVFIVLGFFFAALNSFVNDLDPSRTHEYEIYYDNSQPYVSVCNSSNGKIIVKCDFYDEDNKSKLVIYRNKYKFIDPKTNTFLYCHFDDICNAYTWHQPVGTNKGTDNVSIVLSDKVRGNGNYDFKTSLCHYLYLEIKNYEDKEVSIGETYMLEIYEYGQWRSLPFKKSVDLVNSACIVEPKGTKMTYFDFLAYGDLGQGKYRIALSSDENSTSFYYVKFTVNEEGTIKLT